jgi:SpoVK/Ycf46/Vps4 family AAA+-type ATPase
MPEKFSLLRNDRDAWAAIRGYAYQVDRTLVSWLKLGPGEALELECGEDIDLLAPSLSPESSDIKRTLEQVKCLDRTVTLRSISTREALCSFFDHVQENPSLALHFRFLTNAVPGEENPASPLLFVPGIQLWKDIRHGRVEAEKRRAAIESIGSFLEALEPPRPTMADSWQKVLASTRDFDRLSAMIANLDWATAAAGPDEIVDEVEQLLLELGHAGTRDDAKARYDQLFVFVLKMLARRKTEARKRLDVKTLESCLASGAISSPERELMGQMKGIRESMLERFTSLDADAAEIKGGIREIHSILQGERRELVTLKPVVSTSAIRESFRVASAGLLAWPQETRGRWLERPELEILENTILAEPQSCTLLLGPPGAGKSAILARLGTHLERTGTLLLALKTDQLPQNVERLGDLDAFLDLQIPLVDTILELARRERVVLLIDQLDALASLMDQRTNRLHVVLRLIHRLKGTTNVHLVISCRQFDFQYDSRFASLKADPVYLADPPFEDVRGFLNESGVNTGTWPSDMCQMLRNPQHLNIFLSHFGGDSDPQLFGTYQSMLEATFKRRVLDAGTALTPAACEQVAAQMSETEELWIGRSAFDQQYPTEIDRLIAAGILQEKGRTVGFRHQTLFDYVRTRAFCTGVSSLSEHILARQDSVFVRSTAWASLHALRASSFERYRAEMETLWAQPALRKHLRLLLISFLGQVAEPDVREVQWLMTALENALLRGKVLAGVFGNPAWFARLQARLPGLMADPDALLQGQITMLLRAALEFARPSVLRLVSRHWSLPDSDPLVLQVFHDFSDWDDETTRVVEVILQRQSIQPYFVVHIAQSAAKKRAGYGARLVVAAITNAVQSGIEQVDAAVLPPEENGDGLEASMSRYVSTRKRLEPVIRLIDTMDWHGLEEVAEAEPAAFAAGVLPLVLRIGSVLAAPESHRDQYQNSTEVELDGEIRGRHSHILQSLKLAFQRWAEKEPDAFLRFAGQVTQSGLLIAHRLLAYGFERAACARPDAVMTYLVGDARRLSLGGYQDQHHETRLLIAAVSAHLPSADLHALEQAIAVFDMYKNAHDDEAEARRRRRRWNREHRLRLLRAIPTEKLSADARKHRNEEEIALPGTRDYDSRIEGGFIGSPVSAAQMGKAADEDVLNVFSELRDDTGTSHPRFSRHGGSYQASQAFAAFAKEHPARAIAIIEQFEPGTQELPAAYAIESIAQSMDVEPGVIVDLIIRLSERGFSSNEFRERSGWTLQKLASKSNGLPDAVCEILESWITPASGEDSDESKKEEIDLSKQPHSIVWGPGRGGTLPHGNYPLLLALEWGYRCRTTPDVDLWLEVLCRHLTMTEHVAVWRTLVAHLDVLGAASDRNRVLEFLKSLFVLFPGALACASGVFFLAGAVRWLPAEFLEQCLRIIEGSSWAWKEQAIGEIAMLSAVLNQTDEYCRSVVDRAVSGKGNEQGANLRRVGIAFASVNLWAEPKFRTKSHEALMQLARDADGYLPSAVMDVFHAAGQLPPDAKTRELLSVIVDNPDLIQRGEASFLIDRLKELLADGFDPSLIAAVTRSLLTAGGSALGDIRTGWAANARDLIEITITLQRITETRSVGLDQFEMLMDLGAYEASQVLRELDRRPV